MSNSQHLLKGALAGLVAGAAASALMNYLVSLHPLPTANRGHGAQSIQPGQPDHGLGASQIRRDGAQLHRTEDATERLADCLAWGLWGLRLTGYQKYRTGKLIHYLFGSGSAAAYGLLAECLPALTAGFGIPFGLAVWLGADEGTVPLIGLSTAAYQQPWSVQATSIGSHCAYGLTCELIRKSLRASLLA